MRTFCVLHWDKANLHPNKGTYIQNKNNYYKEKSTLISNLKSELSQGHPLAVEYEKRRTRGDLFFVKSYKIIIKIELWTIFNLNFIKVLPRLYVKKLKNVHFFAKKDTLNEKVVFCKTKVWLCKYILKGEFVIE